MKTFAKRTLLCAFLSMFCILLNAQELQEVIYLNNGSVIRGIIIEQVPNNFVKIQTTDGNIFVYGMKDVLKITKEPYAKVDRDNSNTSIREKGYRGFIDGGYTFGVGDFADNRIDFSTSHGYQFNPYLFAGLGLGAQYYFDNKKFEMPLFAHFRGEFLKGAATPFIDFKVGYTVLDATGFYMNPSVGCRFAINKNLGLNFHFGYSMQIFSYSLYIIHNEDGNYYEDKYTTKKNFGGLNVKIGLDF